MPDSDGKAVFADHPHFTAIVSLLRARDMLDCAINNLRDKVPHGAMCCLRAVFKHLGEALPEIKR